MAEEVESLTQEVTSTNEETSIHSNEATNHEPWNYVWDANLGKTTLKLLKPAVYTPPIASLPIKDPKRFYVCSVEGCNRTFRQGHFTSYQMHIKTHLPESERPFKCNYPECTKSFVIKRYLVRHNLKHMGVKPYKCEQCGQGLMRAASLNRHLKIHIKEAKRKRALMKQTAVPPKEVTSSDDSNATIATDTEVTNHQSKDYQERDVKEPIKESETNADFSDFESSEESDPPKPKYNPEKRYKCPEEGCCKMFTLPSLLERHSWTHSGHRPYKCDKCGKGFARKDYLNKHLKAHLNNPRFKPLKPFKCDYLKCSKAFTKKNELDSHMRTHTGGRPHKCKQCDKAFARIKNLYNHVKTHKESGALLEEDCEEDDSDVSSDFESNDISSVSLRPTKLEVSDSQENDTDIEEDVDYIQFKKEYLMAMKEENHKIVKEVDCLQNEQEYLMMTKGERKKEEDIEMTMKAESQDIEKDVDYLQFKKEYLMEMKEERKDIEIMRKFENQDIQEDVDYLKFEKEYLMSMKKENQNMENKVDYLQIENEYRMMMKEERKDIEMAIKAESQDIEKDVDYLEFKKEYLTEIKKEPGLESCCKVENTLSK